MFKYCLDICSDCNSSVELRAVSGVQGTLKTPFFPNYYPPDTNCTWTFHVSLLLMHVSVDNLCFHTPELVFMVQMPALGMGLSLEFEGYELSRAGYQQACTQGQWIIQNRRYDGCWWVLVERPSTHPARGKLDHLTRIDLFISDLIFSDKKQTTEESSYSHALC